MDVTILAVFVIGLISAIVGAASGGGGALIAVPGLILVGLPPQLAIGTSKLGNIGTVISSIYTFQKKHLINYKIAVPLSIVGGAGSFIGASAITAIDPNVVEPIIAVFLILAIPFLLLSKNFGEHHKHTSKKRHELGYVCFFFLAAYIGFLGAGGGFMVAMLFISFFGMTFLEANATFKIPWLFMVLIAIYVFAKNGFVDYFLGSVLIASRLIGGYIGSQIAIHEGSHFVKYALTAVVFVSSIKILFF